MGAFFQVMKRQLSRLVVVLLLAACSNVDSGATLFEAIVSSRSSATDPKAKALYDAGAPRLRVAFPKTDRVGLMVLEASRNGIETWVSAEGATLILERGMLKGTRGFGAGLLASDVSQSLEAVLSGRQGYVDRFHTFLTGEDRATTLNYKCEIENRGADTVQASGRAFQARLVAEKCSNSRQSFENLYWVSGSRGIVQSTQWAGDFLGFVNLRVPE